MNSRITISKLIAVLAWFVVLTMFLLSVTELVWLFAQNVYSITSPTPSQHAFELTTTDAILASKISFTNGDVEGTNLIDSFWFIVLALCFSFLGLCLGGPFYIYLNYKRPAKQLIRHLQNTAEGKKSDWKLAVRNSTLYSLTKAVKNLADLHINSEEFIYNIGEGNLDVAPDKIDTRIQYGRSLLSMQKKLRQLSLQEKHSSWINEKLTELEKILKTETDGSLVATQITTLITKSVSAGVGILYGIDDKDPDASFFYPLGFYGFYNRTKTSRQIFLGEGQLGEVGVQRKTVILDNVPGDYLVIHSGLGSSTPTNIILVPLLFKGGLYGAIELASFRQFEEHEIKWLERAAESLAAHFFNQNINDNAKRKLEELADKQARELVEIHRLQEQTYHSLELKLKEVEEEKHKNEAILHGCVDGVISFNERGDIHFCNPVAAEIFGGTKEVILQKRIFELIPVHIDFNDNELRPFYRSPGGDKAITVRTEASLKNFTGDNVDVLITSTQVHVQNKILFTFFIQKISVDLF